MSTEWPPPPPQVCDNCGAEFAHGAPICPNCGHSVGTLMKRESFGIDMTVGAIIAIVVMLAGVVTLGVSILAGIIFYFGMVYRKRIRLGHQYGCVAGVAIVIFGGLAVCATFFSGHGI